MARKKTADSTNSVRKSVDKVMQRRKKLKWSALRPLGLKEAMDIDEGVMLWLSTNTKAHYALHMQSCRFYRSKTPDTTNMVACSLGDVIKQDRGPLQEHLNTFEEGQRRLAYERGDLEEADLASAEEFEDEGEPDEPDEPDDKPPTTEADHAQLEAVADMDASQVSGTLQIKRRTSKARRIVVEEVESEIEISRPKLIKLLQLAGLLSEGDVKQKPEVVARFSRGSERELEGGAKIVIRWTAVEERTEVL